MTLAADIETVLRQHLPADHHGAVTALALVLADAAIGMVSPAQAQARLSALNLASAVRALAGHEIRAGSTVISFGAGSQIGDVSIGDVAGGSITKLSLSVGVIQHVSVSGQGRVGDVIGVQNNYNYYTTPSPADRVQRLAVARSRHSQERFAELRQGFVGRRAELTGITAEIDTLRTTGGYLLITGVAGQGKSGVLAALTAELGAETTPAYFIRFSPGADEQVALLRHLVAELLIQHGLEELADSYLPETAGTITLANSLAMVLDRVNAAGQQAILVIDGLDQIRPDRQMGERDLSFLPEKLPAGVVIVIGTRPDDTLKPLRVLASQREYKLPWLSQDDFGALLDQRGAALAAHDRQVLYEALHGNAFDLAFIAREIASIAAADVPALLERVRRNPQDIFAPALDRLRGDQNTWRRAIRPILGCLLAATGSEPLSEDALGVVVGLDTDEVSDGLLRLRGFLGETDRAGRAYYYLYHLRLIDYLTGVQAGAGERIFSPRDIEQWHGKLASWCEGGTVGINTIWQDTLGDTLEQERRTYARQHYIAHLAAAHSYERLWGVIDAGEYGAAKRRFDPSTRSYALDLDIACQSLIDATVGDMEAQARSLPRLWRYSLLRCSITSYADLYPEELFLALVQLKRGNEALDLAELLSDAEKKVNILRVVGVALHAQEPEQGLHVLLRARIVVDTMANEPGHSAFVLTQVVAALNQVGRFDQAQEIAESLSGEWRDIALSSIAEALAQVGQIERAQVLATSLRGEWQTEALRAILIAFIRTGQVDQVSNLVQFVPDLVSRDLVLRDMAIALAQAGWFEEAQRTIEAIASPYTQAETLLTLAESLVSRGLYDQAEPLLTTARAIAENPPREAQTTELLVNLAGLLAQAGQVELAVATSGTIAETRRQPEALNRIVIGLARVGQFDQARTIAETIADPPTRVAALTGIASALSDAGQEHVAARTFDEALATAETIRHTMTQAGVLRALVAALSPRTQFRRARDAVNTISDPLEYVAALSNLASRLAAAGVLHEATQTLDDARRTVNCLFHPRDFAYALGDLAEALARAGQFDQAQATIEAIQDTEPQESALRALAEALAVVGYFDQARTVADTIADAGQRALTLSAVAKVLTATGDNAAAHETFTAARTAANRSYREGAIVHVLSALAKDLASVGYSERAAETIAAAHHALAGAAVAARPPALRAITEAQVVMEEMIAAQARSETAPSTVDESQQSTGVAGAETDREREPDSRSLPLSQAKHVPTLVAQLTESWRHTQTRDKLLDSFAVDATLLRAYPELGQAFLDSFAWVDAQLAAV